MLDPRDQAVLVHAVRAGLIAEPTARELAQRYRGAPGAIGDALVEARVLSPAARDALLRDLHAAPAPPRGSTPPPAALAPPRGTTPPPGAPRPPEADSRAGTVEAAPASPPGLPRIPGYTLEAELGRGGMGVVYKGVQLATGRVVALKLLLNTNEQHVKRFEREASALLRLRHPNVVELVETGQTNGQPFLVMAFEEGGDLKAALGRGRLPRRKALAIVSKVGRAIALAHSMGVYHRDLKPANVLLSADGEPRVTDFGLAKVLDRQTQLTQTGATLGTPHYMAPEQVRGEEATAAVDAYALGVMLFLAVTGQLPFEGASGTLFTAIVTKPPPRPWVLGKDVPRDLGQLILAALEKDPRDRPSADAIAQAIEDHLAGRRLGIVPPSQRRRRLVAAGAAAGGLLLLATSFTAVQAVLERRRAEQEERQAEASVETLREALAAARRARGTRDVAGLTAEADAHRLAADALAAVPPSRAHEAAELYRQSQALGRRCEVLALLVARLLEERRAADAVARARDLVAVSSAPASQAVLARALAEDPATAAEACRAALAAAALASTAASGADVATLAAAAEALLRVRRPELAARVLAAAPAELRPLRLRAHLEAGEHAAARADLEAELAERPRDRASLVTLARLDVRGGDAAAALARLEPIRAGGDPAWLVAMSEAQQALGRVAAARRALNDALAIDPGLAAERGRFHLRRGRRLAALADLTGAPDARSSAAVRLDACVARWLGGGGDADALAELGELVAAARAFQVTSRLGAAAARWQARLELAREGLDAALAAAEAALELEPGPASAALRARCLLRRGDAEAALAALGEPAAQAAGTGNVPGGQGVEDAAVRAQVLLRLGRAADAEALLPALPEQAPARADLARAFALRRGDTAALAAAEEAVFRSRARAGDPASGPVAVPVASDAEADPTGAGVARLVHEARRVLGAATRDEATRGLATLLLRRALGLDPDHLPARLALATATGDAAAVDAVIRAWPHLRAARRLRVRILEARHQAGGRGDFPVAQVADDLAVLLTAPDVTPLERLRHAQALVAAGHKADALAALAPLFDEEPRFVPAFQLGERLARELGDSARQAALAAVLAEVRATQEQYRTLRQQAWPRGPDTDLALCERALTRIGRDLPREADYYWVLTNYEFYTARRNRAVLSGAEYLVRKDGLEAWRPSFWTYAHGYSELESPEEAVELQGRAAAARPQDAGPHLGRALYLLARLHNRAQPDPEDAEAAADAALAAVERAPHSSSALALAGDAHVECGDPSEAAQLLSLALLLDPDHRFAIFQLARVAAASGDVARALELLERSGRPDGQFDVAGYTFARDPAFRGVLQDERMQAYVQRPR